MADKVSPTLRVLLEIRDELKQHGQILRDRLDQRERVDDLDRRVTRIEARLPTE